MKRSKRQPLRVGRHTDDAAITPRCEFVSVETETLVYGSTIGGREHIRTACQFVHAFEIGIVSEVKVRTAFADIDPQMLRECIRIGRRGNVKDIGAILGQGPRAARTGLRHHIFSIAREKHIVHGDMFGTDVDRAPLLLNKMRRVKKVQSADDIDGNVGCL